MSSNQLPISLANISEIVEQISHSYAAKHNIERSGDWFMLKLQEEVGEVTQAYLMMTKQARSKDKSDEQLHQAFAEELADALCHVLLLAKKYNVNIDQQIEDKWLVWQTKWTEVT